ncbi:hypothetical protein ACFL6I_01220 [candidate division KSB1 bacterium]
MKIIVKKISVILTAAGILIAAAAACSNLFAQGPAPPPPPPPPAAPIPWGDPVIYGAVFLFYAFHTLRRRRST